jgi:hypothetical protein
VADQPAGRRHEQQPSPGTPQAVHRPSEHAAVAIETSVRLKEILAQDLPRKLSLSDQRGAPPRRFVA